MIAEKIKALKNELPSHVKLVVVSKFRTISEIMEVYQTGHRVFGENRIQNLMERKSDLPDDIEWHLIGQLQTNKVKYISSFISMIHSLDSLKLAREIQKYGVRHQRSIDCLIQIHIAREETKSGILPSDLDTILAEPEWQNLTKVNIRGVMAMASNVADEAVVRQEFKSVYAIFKRLKEVYFRNSPHFDTISMGMSNDHKIAVEEGSNLVRIGSLIFE